MPEISKPKKVESKRRKKKKEMRNPTLASRKLGFFRFQVEKKQNNLSEKLEAASDQESTSSN